MVQDERGQNQHEKMAARRVAVRKFWDINRMKEFMWR